MAEPTILVSTWEDGLCAVTGPGCRQEIAGQSLRGLAQDEQGRALVIAGEHEVRQRTAEGEWSTVAKSEFPLSCIVAVQDSIYVGTDDARILKLIGHGVFENLEGFGDVPGREIWFAGSAIINGQRVGPPLGVRSLAASLDGTLLFANVHVGGIPRSTDRGKTWQPTIDIGTDVHEVCVHPTDPKVVAAASAVGLCISRDSGITWTIENGGLHATHCSAVAFSGSQIFFSASLDPFAAKGKIYRRPIRAEASIAAVEGGMPEWTEGIIDTSCIAANGPSVAVADRAGNLYYSGDFGSTWVYYGRGMNAPSGVLIL